MNEDFILAILWTIFFLILFLIAKGGKSNE